MTLVADYSKQYEIEPYTVSIYSLGIMGTVYERSIEPDKTIQITRGQVVEVDVYDIAARYPIGNELDIRLRHPVSQNAPDPISYTRHDGFNRIKIDGTIGNFLPGNYTLMIESYDQNGNN